MSWVKLDDGFPENPKVETLSDRAFRVHVTALCYCGRNLTDGFVSKKGLNVVTAMVGFRTKTHVEQLTRHGLWTPYLDGFRLKDFLDYNPSAETVKQLRKERREAGRKGGLTTQSNRHEANAQANGSDRFGTTPSPPVPLVEVQTHTHALTHYEGHDYQLWTKLCAAAGVSNSREGIQKLERTVRSRKSTPAHMACAIEAATGPGVIDPLAVALSELVKQAA